MSGSNNDVEWVETTEEVVITDDGSPSDNNLAGMIELLVLFIWIRGLVTLQTYKWFPLQ